MSRRKSREQAFLFIFESAFGNSSVENIISCAKTARDIEIFDYAENIFRGVKKNEQKIEKIIDTNTISWKKERLSKIIFSILKLSIYEILFCDDVPIKVAINEAIELAKKYTTTAETSYIHGVLGSVTSELQAKKRRETDFENL
jgi:N utilization substance protein B